MTPHAIRRFLASHRMRVIPKRGSWLMLAIGWLLRVTRINQRFCERYTTVVWRHVYYPDSWGDFDLGNDAQVREHAVTFEHEFVHRTQVERLWILFPFVYLVFPLPFLLAWGRWRLERDAYLVNIRNGRSIESCVESLWQYGWPWPRAWMRRWFNAAIREIDSSRNGEAPEG